MTDVKAEEAVLSGVDTAWDELVASMPEVVKDTFNRQSPDGQTVWRRLYTNGFLAGAQWALKARKATTGPWVDDYDQERLAQEEPYSGSEFIAGAG